MSAVKKLAVVVAALAVMAMALCACGGGGGSAKGANCEVTSAKYVDSIQVDSISYSWEDGDILELVFDVTANGNFDLSGVEGENDRAKIYKVVADSCTLTNGGEEVSAAYGYWPKEATGNTAKDMTLFYVVPKGTDLSALTFTLDGKALGDDSYKFTYTPSK